MRVTALVELSRILNTGLSREALSVLVDMCEQGVNPNALATVVRELKREAQVIRENELVEAQQAQRQALH
jgi:pentatricopeptide repeat protein